MLLQISVWNPGFREVDKFSLHQKVMETFVNDVTRTVLISPFRQWPAKVAGTYRFRVAFKNARAMLKR